LWIVLFLLLRVPLAPPAAVVATTLAVLAASAVSSGWAFTTVSAMGAGALVSLGRAVVLRALVVRRSPGAPAYARLT
jgi:hypothetical protein